MTKKKNEKRNLNFRVRAGDRAAFARLAKQEGLSLQALVEKALAEEMERIGQTWKGTECRAARTPRSSTSEPTDPDAIALMSLRVSARDRRSLGIYSARSERSVQEICNTACARLAANYGITWSGVSGNED